MIIPVYKTEWDGEKMNIVFVEQKEVTQATRKREILNAEEVFFQLGVYVDGIWTKTKYYLKAKKENFTCDEYLDDPEYLRHHNFMIGK